MLDEHKQYLPEKGEFDAVFDLNFDEGKDTLSTYSRVGESTPVFVSSAKKQLARMQLEFGQKVTFPLFGLNALPSFINRSRAEVSALTDSSQSLLKNIMGRLGWEYILVEDRVGLVTPRVVCMIINEACYTLQEGTARMRDIDTSMRMGTNYPYGPFEWADKIGVKDVYELLDAVYADTHDERYKICTLLKTRYLKAESFYA